jgi:hypothetical protein
MVSWLQYVHFQTHLTSRSRVDLRPTTSHASSDEESDPNHLAPPIGPEQESSYRRRSALRDILSLRSRPNASAEERISALRRLRDARRNLSGENVTRGSANASAENVAAARRSRRISARLSGVFSSRSRRHGQDDVATTVPTTTVPATTVPATIVPTSNVPNSQTTQSETISPPDESTDAPHRSTRA